MLDIIIILVTTILLGILLEYFYKSPTGKNYTNHYIAKTGYLDTALMIFF